MKSNHEIFCKWCRSWTTIELELFCSKCSGCITFPGAPDYTRIGSEDIKGPLTLSQMDKIHGLDKRLNQYRYFLTVSHVNSCRVNRHKVDFDFDKEDRLDMRLNNYDLCTCSLYEILVLLEFKISELLKKKRANTYDRLGYYGSRGGWYD
jgi:hypothetical protein